MKPIIVAIAALSLSACGSMPVDSPRATAQLQATKGSKASGEASFEQAGDKVRVVVNVQGLKPGQQHGFHIHEAGDCSSGDGMSTKGHFNPLARPHAHPGSGHAGDLPALQADQSGRARLDVMAEGITVAPGPTSIVGRGLIVHADPDDYKTQPTGNAGARIACGVIRAQ